MQSKKLICVFTALLLCLGTLISCSSDSSPVVISLGAGKISANMYNYWASTSKGNFLNAYSEMKDTEEFWNTEYTNGKTYAQYFDELILSDVKLSVVCMMLYNDYRLSISDTEKQRLKTDIDDYIKDYADGNKNALNKELSEYGVNTDILYNIRLQEAKRTAVYDYLYGDSGITPLTDEQKEAFYQKNYVRFQLIYINNKYEYVLDENGKYTTDSDGSYVTKALSEEASTQKNAAISTVKDSLTNGGDFNSLYEEYSELKAYENGYYYSSTGSYSSEVFYQLINDVSEVQTGEIALSESDYGTYIMKRMELDTGAWDNTSNSDFFDDFDTAAGNSTFREFASQYYDQIEINTDAIKDYSIAKVNQNYNF